MSNLRPLIGQANPRVPTPPRGESIARYETYLEAQRAVDYLSDQQFPVQAVTIVGTGLRMVERVTGRLTYPRVAGASALSGLYFGFFVGLALSLFGGGTDLSIFAVSLVGAGFGMLFGIISYALTGGRRDFTSTSQIVASEYEVLCLAEQANVARDLLRRLPGGIGRGRRSSEPGVGAGWAGGGSGVGTRRPSKGAGSYGESEATGPNPYAAGGQAQHPGDGSPTSGGPSPYGPPPAGAPSSGPSPGEQGAQPGHPGAGRPEGEPAPTQLVGPTYGEMMERQRQEQRTREAAEREAAEREAAERLSGQSSTAQPAPRAERSRGDGTTHDPGGGPDRRDDPEPS